MRRPPANQVCAALLVISGFLAVAGWVARRIGAATERGSLDMLMLKFDLAQEDALAVWFSTALFLTIAGLAWAGGQQASSHHKHWRGLAAIALLLSIEQVVHFHQVFVPLADRHVGRLWILGAGVALAGLCALYVPWLRALPSAVAKPVRSGIALLLAAAIGLELLGSRLVGSVPAPLSDLIMSLEEGLELTGLSLVIYGLLVLHESGATPAEEPPA